MVALRRYGHDLARLLTQLEAIGHQCGASATQPPTAIHKAMIATLADFATNVTRYYNLKLVGGDSDAAGRDGPVTAWYRQVREPILALHYTDRQRRKVEANARAVDALMGQFTLVRHYAETGDLLDSVYEASRRTGETEVVTPWERMYVLQIARFIGDVLGELGHVAGAQRLPDVPDLSEFFRIFNNDDRYFRTRKTWATYRP